MSEWQKIVRRMTEISDVPPFIDDSPNMTQAGGDDWEADDPRGLLRLTQAVPPVAPSGMLVPGPDLTGRVVTYRTGRPEAMRSCSVVKAHNLSPGRTTPIPKPASGAANR
jgi:hypothetical protein